MANRTNRTVKKREEFLEALRLSEGNVSKACEAAHVPRRTAYDWRGQDAHFADLWDEVVEAGTDTLEDEAFKRAKSSSDLLLIFLLKSRRPEKYRENVQLDVTSGGKPLLGPLASALDKAYGNGKQ